MSQFQNHIIERCRQNDRKAQLQLYQNYCNGMFIVASRFLKNTMEAEDVVQESFIKAFQKLEQYKAEVSFGAWLKRIVINGCIDTIKRKKDYTIELVENHLNVVDNSGNDNWLVDNTVSIEHIKSAIETLPEPYKYVVMLYLIEGYDHQEISEILNISETASRTQLYRGKQKLLQKLNAKKNGTRH